MKIKFLLLLIIFSTLTSCKKDIADSFSSETKKEVFKKNCNVEPCAEVTVDYVILKGNKSISKKINHRINQFIVNSLAFEDSLNTNHTTIAEAADGFLNNYEKDKAEFPDIISEYYAEISVDQTYTSHTLFSFELQQYLFTGGAHGYGAISFLNVNPTNGEKLSTHELFNDVNEFRGFVEKEFRKEYNISAEESINSTGFWFENDTFYLPETIGFNDEEVIILYNQYEISSYASGPIELRIPLDEVLPFMASN